MQLTERQCWKVIRDLASTKNTEYKELLNGLFGGDIEKTKQIQGDTRDAFLRGHGVYSLNQFFSQYKRETKTEPDTRRWLDNLNSESLLIFLDFRCRVLQRIYDYYAKYRNIDSSIIKKIIDTTHLSPLSKFKLDDNNKVALSYSRKPGRAPGGEKKLSELEMSSNDLNEQALAQIMGKLVGGYMQTQKATKKYSVALASKLVTQNITYKGNRTGYQYQGKVAIVPQKPAVVPKPKIVLKEPEKKEYDMYVIGFGKDKMPIFLYKGQKVDFFKNPIPDAKIVYDPEYNKIEEIDDSIEEIDKNQQTNKKFVGIDIEGRPIYEVEGDYYNSLGQRLPEDAYIQTDEESLFGR